jgi:hypothetical protein
MTDPNSPPKKRKILRRLLLMGLIVMLIGGAWHARFRWGVNRRLTQQLQWLESRGYPVTPEQLNDWYSLPEGAGNAADYYMEAFADLVPALLNAVPIDPFDGQTLRYVRQANGFVIYSVGADRQDNGGVERDPKNGGKQHDIPFSVEFLSERR